jgi:hypothetical protein
VMDFDSGSILEEQYESSFVNLKEKKKKKLFNTYLGIYPVDSTMFYAVIL